MKKTRRTRRMSSSRTSTPTDFLIASMDGLDDVEMVLVVRKHKDNCISYDTNTHSGWDAYALAGAAKTLSFAHTVKRTIDGE
jgi:hypothetical protein